MCGCGCRPGILGILGKAAWLITVLAALNIGLAAAGFFDFWTLAYVVANAHIAKILAYVIGVCGAWGLFTFGMAASHCMSGKCSECK